MTRSVFGLLGIKSSIIVDLLGMNSFIIDLLGMKSSTVDPLEMESCLCGRFVWTKQFYSLSARN